jgi:predicted HicB family RNase H-like nuclease
MAEKFRKPKDIRPEEVRVPVSARIPESVRDFLAKEAKKHGHSLGKLIESVLEDYAKFLKSNAR